MAVEIPVVVDVMGGISKAEKDIPKAQRILQSGLSKEALSIEIKIDTKGAKEQIASFVDGSITDIKQFRKAISQIKTEIQNLSLAGKLDTSSGQGKALQDALMWLTKYKKAAEDAANAPLREEANRERLNVKLQQEQEFMLAIENTMYGISEKIKMVKDELETTKIDSPKFEDVAEKFRNINAEMEAVERRLQELGTKTGSIDNLSLKLNDLQKAWAAMPFSEMVDASGQITKPARDIINEYTKASNQLEKQKDLLNVILNKQKEAAAAARRKAAEEERQIEALIREEEELRKHQAALVMNVSSMNDLNAKMSAWQQELNSADIGSKKWYEAAENVTRLSQEIKNASDALSSFGVKTGSIDALNLKIQQLNKEWNAMSKQERFVNGDPAKGMTDRARAVLSMYKQTNEELRNEAANLERIAQKEQKRIELINKGAQRRRYENAILNSTVKTMRVLQEQERILSERLNTAVIGSNKYEAIKAQLSEVRKEIEKGKGSIDGVTDSLKRQSMTFSQLRSMAATYLSVFGAFRFLKNVRDVTAELEMQKVALGSIIQDTQKAESLFSQIKAAALKSPFEIKDLVTFTKQLSAYRIETEKLFDTTMRLADISAGLGVDMSRLILAFGQVRAASVLRGQELRQFTEAGIPLVEQLADKFSALNGRLVSTAEVFDLISKRAVPFSMIEEIFNDMTNAGGTFYKMQEKQSETLLGQWMKLKDAFTIMYDEIGNVGSINAALKGSISLLNSLAKNWRVLGSIIPIAVTGWISYAAVTRKVMLVTRAKTAVDAKELALQRLRERVSLRAITNLLSENAAKKLSIWWTRKYAAAQAAAATSTGVFSAALAKLKLALLTNPFTAIVVAIGAAVTGIISLVSALKKTKISFDEFSKSIEESVNALNKLKETENLLNIYDNLSKKEKRTSEETEKLKNVTKELGRLYPNLIKGVDEFGNGLDISAGKIKELTKLEKEAIKLTAEEQVKQAQEQLSGVRKEIEVVQRFLSSGITYYRGQKVPLTEKERVEFAEKLISLLGEEAKWLNEIESATARLRDEELGPPIPQFFGDAIKTQFSNYKTLLKSTSVASKAFTSEEIKGFSSLNDALDQTVSRYKEQESIIERAQAALEKAEPDSPLAKQLQNSIDDAKSMLAMYRHILVDFNALSLLSKGKTQSPLSFLKEELKNVQEIYKRYQDLLKYMSKGDAIKEIQKIYGNVTAIDFLAPQDYKKRLSDILKKMRAIKVPAEAQQELFSAILDTERLVQDVDFSELEKSIKDMLTNLSNSVKRSKEARNFFQDILSASGDQELATNLTVSIYGSIGDDLQKNIKEQLKGAFVVDVDILPSGLSKEDLNKAIESMDWTQLTKYLPYVSQAYRSTAESIVKEAKDASKEQIKQWMSELAATRSIAQRRIDIAMKTAQTIRDINASAIPEQEKQTLIDAATKKEAKEVAKLQYEAFKNSPIYVQMFDNLESSTTSMLKNMRNEIVAMQGAWAELDPNQLKELESRLNKIDALIAERKPFSTLAASLKELFQYGPAAGDKLGKAALDARREYNLLSNSLSTAIQKQIAAQEEYNNAVKKYGADSQEAKDAEIRLQQSRVLVQNLKKQADEAERLAKEAENANKSYADLLRHISDGIKGLSEVANSIQKTGDGVMDIAAAFGASEESLQSIQDAFSSIMDMMNGFAETATGVTQLISGNLIQGIPALISGIGKLAKGIASAFSNAKKYEKIIRRQQKIVDELAYAYSRLEVAADNAFGTEQISNYADKLKNLQAQAEAYRKMADAENKKGKSRSQDKYEEYLKSEREILDQMKDAAQELANFFAGTDLASAASSFAEAWLSAYREFGDTTTAIAEEYDKMIENMVAKSVVGEVIKNQLKPLFDTLQEYSTSEGELSVGEIANLAKQAPGYVQRINTVLEALMGELQASGLNLRVKPGQFTGMSKDIAGASEEAITGLAAGINTQNFYMSHIDQTVSAILSTISGGVSPEAAAQGAQEMSPYQTQSLAYMSSLPQMRDDMAAIRSMLDKVIKPTGVSSGYRVII